MRAGDEAQPEGLRPEQYAQLDSWKEIAAYFKRDVRTVRRWEATEGLPVHRHLHNERGSVYAFRNELDAWWSSRHKKDEPAATIKPSLKRWFWPALSILLASAAVGLYFLLRTAISPRGTSADRLRVVVLPFESPKAEVTEEPLGDLVAGDVISKLGHVGPERLAVIAYTSSMIYRGAGKRAGEIGRELSADYLVEGSLRRAGDRLFVTARLVETRGETLLRVWEYERPSTMLAGLADEVAEAVAKTLGLVVTHDRRALARARSIDPAAYQLYLRARYRMDRRSGGRELVRKYLEEAIEREPDFAAAHAALGDLFSRNARIGDPDARADNWAKADGSAKRALKLDETLPAGHVVLATIRLFRDWAWEGARAEFLRAIELDRADPYAHTGYAVYLRAVGNIEEAITERQRALESDPLSVPLIELLGVDYVYARRYDDAIRELQRALDLEPDYRPAVGWLAEAYALKRLDDQAALQKKHYLTLQGSNELALQFEAVYKAQGYKAAERWLDEKQIEQFNLRPAANLWNLAYSYARLRDKESAFRYLAEACARRDSGMLQIRVDPDVDILRSDPRFQDLLRRIGPEE